MNRRLVLAMTLAIVLVGMLTLAFNIQSVKSDWTWTETIYIRADGSVEPDTAPISSVDNITYTLTDNIVGDVPDYSSAIVVERDNIVVDGAGYTLQGIGSGTGIALSHRYNVTLKKVEVTNFDNGIMLQSSSNNTITGNTASSNDARGIFLYISSSNVLSGNTASNNYDGIMLQLSSNNTITGNTASNNNYGIHLASSSNNIIYRNNFIGNTFQAGVSPGDVNTWDDGAGKGNYWSDYEDKYSDAEEIDGIWDTPYEIDENNEDNYAIVPEFSTWKLILLLLIVLTVATTIYKRRLLETQIHK